MYDAYNRLIQQDDTVFVASLNDKGKPVITECVVVEVWTTKMDGTPRKAPMLRVRPADKPNQKSVGITGSNVRTRVVLAEPTHG